MKNKEYKKHTIIGYFAMGLFAIVLGFIYSVETFSLAPLDAIINDFSFFKDILPACIVLLFPTLIFINSFFDIRRALVGFDWNKSDESREIYNKTKDELLTDEDIMLNDIDSQIRKMGKDDTQESIQLRQWIASNVQHTCRKFTLTYFAVATAIIVVLIFLSRTKDLYFSTLLSVIIPYSICYLIALLFCQRIANHRDFETLSRMSFNIFFPAFLTIGLNMYVGLSLFKILRTGDYVYCVPLWIFVGFFLFSAIGEIFVNSIKAKVSRKSSTIIFILVGLITILISFVFFFGFNLSDPILKLSFAIIIALFFSIYEAWDSISKMQLQENDPVLVRQIRSLNIMQLICPILVLGACVYIESDIFNNLFVWLFALHSFISSIVWVRGNCKSPFNVTNWRIRKLLMGGLAVCLIIISKAFPESGYQSTVDELNIVFLVIDIVVACILAYISFSSRIKNSVLQPISNFGSYDKYAKNNDTGAFLWLFSIALTAYSIVLFFSHAAAPTIPFIGRNPTELELACMVVLVLQAVLYFLLGYYQYHTKNQPPSSQASTRAP